MNGVKLLLICPTRINCVFKLPSQLHELILYDRQHVCAIKASGSSGNGGIGVWGGVVTVCVRVSRDGDSIEDDDVDTPRVPRSPPSPLPHSSSIAL
jgi:hypothetical protein